MNKRANRNLDVRDGGFLSRKLLFGLALVVVMVGAFLAAARWNALIPSLGVLYGGLVAVYTIYCGANVGNKIGVGGQILKAMPLVEPEPPDQPQG